jgi:GNAT superfamily N-acetyltransferase
MTGTARVATSADVDAIVDVFTTAFFDDPLWGPAFPDVMARARQAAALWRLCVTSALRYPWLLVTPDVEAAALWIPPGGAELTHEEDAGFVEYLTSVASREIADHVVAVFERFEAVHPSEPHYYLSLLGTHDDHRGRGLGMGLLAGCLDRIDAEGAPAYLESCNPANNKRYESVGFVARDTFEAGGALITTMWRPAAPSR